MRTWINSNKPTAEDAPKPEPQPRISQYVYHATDRDKIGAICECGLAPAEQPPEHGDESRCTDEAVLFFAVRQDIAECWGSVVLRFRFPNEAYQDDYGDTILLDDGTCTYTNWYTPTLIVPEQLEILVGDQWLPINESQKG